MTVGDLDAMPSSADEVVRAVTAAARDDARIVGLTSGGSAGIGAVDEFSLISFAGSG